PEQLPQYRNIAQSGNALVGDRAAVLDQACYGEALAAGEFDRRVGAPDGQPRNHLSRDENLVGEVELADLGLDAHADAVAGEQRGREGQTDAEVLEFNGDDGTAAIAGLGHGNRELAAGEETRGLAGQGGQIGLSQNRDEPFGCQGIDEAVEVPTAS